MADCIFSGNGIYPLLSTVYLKKKNKEINDKHKFRTKIYIQKGYLKSLVEMELNFSCVLMESWYFNDSLVKFIESLGKHRICACKSNRLIFVRGEWVQIGKFADEIKKENFKQITLNNKKYIMKTFTVRMKGVGVVRVLISQDEKGNTNFYASNRIDWDEESVAQRYSRRWEIEVWHREGTEMYGLKECQLRCDEGVSKYLALSALADTFSIYLLCALHCMLH